MLRDTIVNIRHFPFSTSKIASRQPVCAYLFDCIGFEAAVARTKELNYKPMTSPGEWVAFELKSGIPIDWGDTLTNAIRNARSAVRNAIEIDNKDVHDLIESAVRVWGLANPTED